MSSDTVAEKKARRRPQRRRRPRLAPPVRQTEEHIRNEKLYSIAHTADFNGSAISTEYANLASRKYYHEGLFKDSEKSKYFGWAIKKFRLEHFKLATFKPAPQPTEINAA
jgi:hypothetical protein